jgi:hypothetical protein
LEAILMVPEGVTDFRFRADATEACQILLGLVEFALETTGSGRVLIKAGQPIEIEEVSQDINGLRLMCSYKLSRQADGDIILEREVVIVDHDPHHPPVLSSHQE